MRQSELVERLHALVLPKTYLQLGSRRPELLAAARCASIVVDEDPCLPDDPAVDKPSLQVYAVTREAFFANGSLAAALNGEPLDLALIADLGAPPRFDDALRAIAQFGHSRTCALVLGDDGSGETVRALARRFGEGDCGLRARLVAAEPGPALLVSGFDASRGAADLGLLPLGVADIGNASDGVGTPVALETALAADDLDLAPAAARFDAGGWEPWTSLGEALRPGPAPERWPRLVFDPPLHGAFRVAVEFAAGGMELLRLRCHCTSPIGSRHRDIHLDIAIPGPLHHELARVTLTPPEEGSGFRLELEDELPGVGALTEIELTPINVWFNEVAPTMEMTLQVREARAWHIAKPRPGRRFVASRPADRPAPHKGRRGARDAVVFAWWTPDNPEAEKVGHYFLELLGRYHPDSKIYIGLNHGTAAQWPQIIRASGLDVEVCLPLPDITLTSDATGFLTALRAYDRATEPFDLVWFGHTKGASQQTYDFYRGARLQIERNFWARRDDVERAFADPKIGLYTARANLYPTFPWPGKHRGWDDELLALQRIYRERYAPVGTNAYETFFALRGTILRRFCDAVGPEFFAMDPRQYGGDRWFFEMAFPSIASMQGYEPFIPMDVPGENDPRDDLNMTYDMKQNHRLALADLERWRQDPFHFTPRVVPWDHPVWNEVRGISSQRAGAT
jgi:hypothetical protein